MAAPASNTKPRLYNFYPDVGSSTLKESNFDLPALHHSLIHHPETRKIPDVMKSIALVTFAQFPNAFRAREVSVKIFEGDRARRVVIIDTSNMAIKAKFTEHTITIYHEKNGEEKNLYTACDISFVIYGNCFDGTALHLFNQDKIDSFFGKHL